MRIRYSLCTIVMLVLVVLAARGAAGKFYPDDPIQRAPETRDASNARPWNIDLTWDLMYNLFARPGDSGSNRRAQNINTIDELPDSSWFSNRILARPLSIEAAVRGPVTGEGPASGQWTVVNSKESGFAPGFTMSDSQGDVWFVSFDGKGYPQAATGALMVANKIFWSLGYWQIENHLIAVRPEKLRIDESAMILVPSGNRRRMRTSDLDEVFNRSERSSDGSYRAVAGKRVQGKVLGGFKYAGTRPDDPNDVVPHEHHRELRALKVFGAWTNLVDMKAGNTLDTIVQESGKGIVRHYLQDVGSTFGTGALGPREYDEGWEYLYEGSSLIKRLVSMGFYIRPWQLASYEENPAIGRFEAQAFDPTQWRPRVPTAAFLLARADDNFWAARRVMAFSDEMIRAIVKTARFSDAAAEKLLSDVLIARRDKIGKVYLTAVNPLVDFRLDETGSLTFVNAAVQDRVASPPVGGYTAKWGVFDNSTNQMQPIGEITTTQSDRIQAPRGLPTAAGAFVKVQIAAVQPRDTSWAVPIDVYFRRVPGGWNLIGLERN